jgi:hypothetical protein
MIVFKGATFKKKNSPISIVYICLTYSILVAQISDIFFWIRNMMAINVFSASPIHILWSSI